MFELATLDPDVYALLKEYERQAQPDEHGNHMNIVVLVQSWVGLLADSPHETKPARVLRRFFRQLVTNMDYTMSRLARLADELMSSPMRGFGQTFNISLHLEFAGSPVFREYKAWYENGSPHLYKYLLSFLTWGKKAEYEDPTLRPSALARWESVEKDLGTVAPPDNLLDDLRFCLSHLPEPDMEKFIVQFGPKMVSEQRVRKYSDKLAVRYSQGLQDTLDYVPADSRVHDFVRTDPELWELGRSNPEQRSIDFSTLLMVRKKRGQMRSICKEPNTCMYHQKGILEMLLAAINSSPFAKVVQLKDQSRNQKAALQASIDGLYDTLDMQDASDRVLDSVISAIFPESWVYHFQASRTSLVRLPDGRVVRVLKFAPMGSRLCFIVQTLYYLAVCCVAREVVRAGLTAESYLKSGALVMSELRIDPKLCAYGDDLIVDASITSTVMSLLTTLGLVVNSEKSYYGTRRFRESCGIFAIDGKDVSPIQFKVKGLVSWTLARVAALIKLHNRCFEAGYYVTADLLKRWIPPKFVVEVLEPCVDGRIHIHPSHLYSVGPDNRRKLCQIITGGEFGYWTKSYMTPIKPVSLHRHIDKDGLLSPDMSGDHDERHDRYQYAQSLHSPVLSDGDKPPKGDVEEPTVRRIWVPA